MDVTSVVLRHVKAGGADAPALSLEDQITWTYGELAEQVYRTANALTDLDVARGDRVGILLKNSLEYWATYLAVARLGAISVRLNWRLAPAELAYALTDSGASVVLVHDELLETFDTVIAEAAELRETIVLTPSDDTQLGGGRHKYSDLLAAASAHEPTVERPGYDDPCMIMYTSGTTGFPKGATWSHGNTLWFSAIQSSYWRFDRDTVHFSTLPMFHVGGFEDWCLPTLTGGGHAVVLTSGSFDITRTCDLARHHQATSIGLLPTMIYALLDLPDANESLLGRVHTIYTGGSPIFREAVDKLRADFSSISLQQTYGLTEGGALVSVMDQANIDEHPMSVGRPLPYTEVRVASLGDESVDAAPGEDGHLWVRSPGVCGNYYNNPDATKETFVDGWCRTGDLARLTDDHFLYLTGRVKDMIISGGENIYPVEIENALSSHPAVRDVAVIGVADAKWGETPCALVVLRDGVARPDQAEIIAYVTDRLASYKKPKYVEFVDELPRNASGKILKRVLREQFDTHVAR